MTYQLTDVELLQAEGNLIISFKPTSERELAKEIEEEIRTLANSYLELRDSIVGFEANKSSKVEKLKKEIEGNKDPLEIRIVNASFIRTSKQEIVQNALKLVCDKLNAQTAAVFLISKNGVLERAGIYGLDKYGKSLSNEWFSEEAYQVGESFTGRAIRPKEGSGYGEIQYTENLNSENLKPKNKKEYLDKLGDLRCAIAIPLNGRNKTYGVLRVVNKIDRITAKDEVLSPSKAPFSKDDVRLLLFLATYIANALSNFRRDVQVEILKYLSRLLIQPSPGTDRSLENTYQRVVDLLVQNPETAFKAGILRIKNDSSGALEVKAISFSPGVTDNRDNSPRKDHDDGFLWLIAENRKRLILQDIQKEDQISQFKNKNWIKDNYFQSFGCFPLVAKNETLGTLSLYTGYNYEFYPDSIEFLQGVADLIASFVFEAKLEELEHYLQDLSSSKSEVSIPFINPQVQSKFKALAKEWKDDTMTISSITQMSIHPAYQQIIGLGSSVVPLLIQELAQNCEPDHWFWALRAITGEDPVKPEQRGRITQMREAWLEWGRKKGYVFS